jgi:hypothetical protein
MTTEHERWLAVDNTREFLYSLLRANNHVPKAVKEEAKCLLKHYPTPYYTETYLQAELKNGHP